MDRGGYMIAFDKIDYNLNVVCDRNFSTGALPSLFEGIKRPAVSVESCFYITPASAVHARCDVTIENAVPRDAGVPPLRLIFCFGVLAAPCLRLPPGQTSCGLLTLQHPTFEL